MNRLIPDGTGGFYLDSGAGAGVAFLLALLALPIFLIGIVVAAFMVIVVFVGMLLPPELFAIYMGGVLICVLLIGGTVLLVLGIVLVARFADWDQK